MSISEPDRESSTLTGATLDELIASKRYDRLRHIITALPRDERESIVRRAVSDSKRLDIMCIVACVNCDVSLDWSVIFDRSEQILGPLASYAKRQLSQFSSPVMIFRMARVVYPLYSKYRPYIEALQQGKPPVGILVDMLVATPQFAAIGKQLQVFVTKPSAEYDFFRKLHGPAASVAIPAGSESEIARAVREKRYNDVRDLVMKIPWQDRIDKDNMDQDLSNLRGCDGRVVKILRDCGVKMNWFRLAYTADRENMYSILMELTHSHLVTGKEIKHEVEFRVHAAQSMDDLARIHTMIAFIPKELLNAEWFQQMKNAKNYTNYKGVISSDLRQALERNEKGVSSSDLRQTLELAEKGRV